MSTLINQPLVSVVMVVRNVERFLAEAIESILGQSFSGFEFIILDFGSTDDSKVIASRYAARDNRIRLHDSPNCNLSQARNAACFLANGEYIAFQDADDISMPDRLQWQVEFMEKHPDCGFLGGAAEWVDLHAKPLWILDFPTEDREIRAAFSTKCPFSHTAVLARREAFVAVGGYRVLFAQAEDYDLWQRMSERYHCANLQQVVVKYRIHPHQISVSGRKQQSLCILAARASAAFRKRGCPDPLNRAKTITPELLDAMGVSQAEVQANLFSDCRDWISNMSAANECSVALKMATEVLVAEWEHVERREIASLQYIVARLHWRQKQFPQSFAAACHALRQQPALVTSLGRAFLRRIGVP